MSIFLTFHIDCDSHLQFLLKLIWCTESLLEQNMNFYIKNVENVFLEVFYFFLIGFGNEYIFF